MGRGGVENDPQKSDIIYGWHLLYFQSYRGCKTANGQNLKFEKKVKSQLITRLTKEK